MFQPLDLQASFLYMSVLKEAGRGPRATKLLSHLHPHALPVSNPCSCSIILGIEPWLFLEQSCWLTKDRKNRVNEEEKARKQPPSTAISSVLWVRTLNTQPQSPEGPEEGGIPRRFRKGHLGLQPKAFLSPKAHL